MSMVPSKDTYFLVPKHLKLIKTEFAKINAFFNVYICRYSAVKINLKFRSSNMQMSNKVIVVRLHS
jgi:hypothetical protein